MEIMSCINYTNDINENNIINGNKSINGNNVYDIILTNIINGRSSIIFRLSKFTFFVCKHYNSYANSLWRYCSKNPATVIP